MKIKEFLTAIIAFFIACSMTFGQELRPLESFNNNETEYLKYNLKKGNILFKGCSFGGSINTLEAKFLVAKINCERDSSSLFMHLYLQSPEYVDDRALKERYLTGISVVFEENNDLKKATKRIMESFPREFSGPMTVSLTDENMNKLINLLNNCKIRIAIYRETVMRTVEFD